MSIPEPTARNIGFTVLIVATIAAVLAAVFLFARQNDNAPIQITAPNAISDAEQTPAEVMVYVSGAVVNPGVYTLDSEDRITDALAAWLFGRRGFYFLAVPLIMVWAYALVSGLPPSVVRAAVMGSVYLVAVGVGRPGSIISAVALSADLMTVVSPEIIQRVSFQLSFAAVAGIALTQPFVPRGVIPTELCRRGQNRAYPAVCASVGAGWTP
jgi:hypothetical protein